MLIKFVTNAQKLSLSRSPKVTGVKIFTLDMNDAYSVSPNAQKVVIIK